MAKQTKATKATNAPAPDSKIDNDAIPHHVDEIGEIPTTAIQLTPVESRINKDIQKFETNVSRDWIAKKKKEYMALTISGVDDKEGKKKVEEAYKDARSRRLGVEKTRKALKEDVLQIGRAIDGEGKYLTDELSPIEAHLKSELDRIENIKQGEKERIQREAEAKLHNNVSILLDNGAKFDGKFYGIGETISVDIVTLREMNDDAFANLLSKVIEKNKEIEKAEDERLEAERVENERVENQRIENERIQKENEEEREALQKEKRDTRIGVLHGLGFSLNSANIYHYTAGSHFYTIPEGDVADFKADEWKDIISLAKAQKQILDSNFKLLQEEEAEQLKKEHLIQLREQQISNLFSMTEKGVKTYSRPSEYECVSTMHVLVSDLETFDNDDWAEMIEMLTVEHKGILEEISLEKKRLDDLEESKRVSALGDAELVMEWLKIVSAAMKKFPKKVESESVLAAYNIFDQKLANAMEELTNALV